MRIITTSAWLLALLAIAAPAASGQRPTREKLRQRLLEKFDKDGDGKLSPAERQAGRQEMRRLRQERRGDQARRGEGRRREGARRGRRRRLPPRLRRALMERFDANHDGRLDPAERREARQALRHLRQERRLHRREGGLHRRELRRMRRHRGEPGPRGLGRRPRDGRSDGSDRLRRI